MRNFKNARNVRVTLVRHGQSEGNVDPTKYTTVGDHALGLTPLGFHQAKKAGERVEHSRDEKYWPTYYVSPYKRTLQTMECVLAAKRFSHISKTDVTICPLLREREWSDRHGVDDPVWSRPAQGESLAQCYDRVVAFFNTIDWTAPNQDIVIVGHGEWIKLAIIYLENKNFNDYHTFPHLANGDVYTIFD
jgi:broad specificity phosphatase PhoE